MSKPAFSCNVVARSLPEQTDAAKDQYAYAYTVTITNTGDTAAQLIAREWWITDNHGQVQEVRGLGVVGHQPLLAPGETFEYTSGTVLATATGSMRGSYFVVAVDGTRFDAPIAEFTLAVPRSLH